MNTFVKTMADAVRRLTRKKSLIETMAQELHEAQFAKLQAESAVEYAESIVEYNRRRIERLHMQIHLGVSKGDD